MFAKRLQRSANHPRNDLPTYGRIAHMLVDLKKPPYNPVQQAETGQKHRFVANAMRAA